MVKSDKNAKKSAAGGIYGGFTASKIRRLIRRAVIFTADFRRTNFWLRIRRSAAAEGSTLKSPHQCRELRESSLYFGCRYSVGSLEIDFIFVSLVGLMEALHQSNFGCPWPRLWLWHTCKETSSSPYLGDYYSHTATLSCSHTTRNGLRGRWHIMWPWPSQKGQNALTYFSVKTWPRTFIFGRTAGVREPPQCLLFGRPWPTFATVIHVQIGLVDCGHLRHCRRLQLF